MFTLWWREKWVRALVLILTPVGFIDATYTILLFNVIGPGFELNPFVRMALESPLWFIWFFVDAISFFLFIMMAGSYYIHTQKSRVNNRTGLVAGLVALRVGLAAHNVMRFYVDFPAVLGGICFAGITFIIVDTLLDRENHVSKEGFKQWWRHITDRYDDYWLMRKSKKPNRGDTTQLDEQIEKEISSDLSKTEKTHSSVNWRLWMKRIGYIVAAIVLFFIMPYFLVLLSILTGVASWSDMYGPLVFWNNLSGTSFILGFIAICIFTSVIMYLVLRSFEVQEGAW
jgi:hypothetical protein